MAQNALQDTFLTTLRQDKIPVNVFLINGVRLTGVIEEFDSLCLILRKDPLKPPHLVYKHAVATIMPQEGMHVTEFTFSGSENIEDVSSLDPISS